MVGLLAAAQAVAQESSNRAPPESANDHPDGGSMRFHLMDGSIIAGRLSIPTLEIDTRFGKLSVPVPALMGFTPGMQSHPRLAKKITVLVEELGDDDFNTRETAQKTLLELGFQCREELERRREDDDTEAA